MRKTTNPDYLNGVPELLVLELVGRRAMHGYELVRAIERTSDHTFQFGEGCIYPILHRLGAQGHLASRRETVDGRSRVVYRLTTSGRKRLSSRVAAWRNIATAIDRILQGESDGEPAVS